MPVKAPNLPADIMDTIARRFIYQAGIVPEDWCKDLATALRVPQETPLRWLNAIEEMTSGYTIDIPSLFKQFDGIEYGGIVTVGPLPFYSLCEHHLLPFHGHAWVGYLPSASSGRIVGLSKLARLVDAHAKRFQVQERLTQDIARDIMTHLDAQGAGCRIESVHTCMAARGIEKEGVMRTQSLLGEFMKPEVRAEFIELCGRAS